MIARMHSILFQTFKDHIFPLMNGKTRRNLKSLAKVRAVDLKIGKKGLTRNFLNEARTILEKDGMLKLSHVIPKSDLPKIIDQLLSLLSVILIEKVGKTMTFARGE